jgi:hypothetical protein
MLTPEQREELRHIAREELDAIYPAAVTLPTITRKISRCVMFQITQQEVAAELQLLRELNPPQVKADQDTLGSTLYWSLTGHGRLANERDGQ